MHSWTEGDGTSGLTWNMASPSTTTYISSTRLSTTKLSGSIGAYADTPQAVSFDVTAAEKAWYAGSASNYGIALKYEGGTNSSVVLDTCETPGDYRAYFVITYIESDITSGVYRIKNAFNGLYLDVDNGGTEAGTKVQQWSKATSKIRNQLFKITYLYTSNNLNYYSIRSMTNSAIGLSSSYTKVDSDATLELISTVDNNLFILDWQRWAITANGSNYTIRNGPVSYNSYLTVPSSTDNGEAVYTTNSVSLRSQWVLEPYAGAELNGITKSSGPSNLMFGEEIQYRASMYSSRIGVNGPVTYSVSNTNGSATDKATINSSTGLLKALKPGQIKVIVSYDCSGTTHTESWDVNIESLAGIRFIQNPNHEQYAQVDDDDAPNYNNNGGIAELQPFDGKNYQKWEFIDVGDGYYAIKSVVSDYAITVPFGKESKEDIDLILTNYTGSDNQKWKITITSHGYYKIKAKSSESITNKDLVMVVQTQVFYDKGWNLRQRLYEDNTSYKDEWKIIRSSNAVQIEAQEQSNWCWVTCARMASTKYMLSPISQASAAIFVKLDVKTVSPTAAQIASANDSGTPAEIEKALEYILGEEIAYSVTWRIYDEATLRSLLDSGTPVIICRGKYDDGDSDRKGGHATIIYDYYWDSAHNMYMYRIYDPSPVNVGSSYSRSYQSICNGRDPAFSSDKKDNGIWESVIVYEKGNYMNTIPYTKP